MNIESFREYCIAKKGVTEEFPFGEETLVFKVAGKMFALTSLDAQPFTANLKCEPEKALTLREQYEAVQPGYHMNKKHWNTVVMDSGEIPEKELMNLIDNSYALVVEGLSKKMKQELESL